MTSPDHSSHNTEALKKIRDEVLALTESPLYAYRAAHKAFPVIGEGNHDASIMFIGEAPGKNEAATGRPFCGASGKLLDHLLSSVAIDRNDVYITNLVKDRPPENRDPFPDEIALYAPFLERQIAIIKPSVIATLGRHSMKYIMQMCGLEAELKPIGSIHGKVFEVTLNDRLTHIVCLYHPAAAIYDRSKLETLMQDFQILKKFKNKYEK
jgi:uracil-DNA glycosylase